MRRRQQTFNENTILDLEQKIKNGEAGLEFRRLSEISNEVRELSNQFVTAMTHFRGKEWYGEFVKLSMNECFSKLEEFKSQLTDAQDIKVMDKAISLKDKIIELEKRAETLRWPTFAAKDPLDKRKN